MIGTKYPVSDVAITCRDLETSIVFYRDKLGLKPRRSQEGFADFVSGHITIALWQLDHIKRHTGVEGRHGDAGTRQTMIAVEAPSVEAVDEMYRDLSSKDVPFSGPPRAFDWNAYCCYFSDPDGVLWEIYAWIGDGAEGYHKIHDQS